MKSTLIIALLVAAVGLGVVCVLQFRKASEQQAQIAALNSALDQQKERVRDLETAKQHLNQQRSDLLDQAEQQAAELSRQIAAAPPPALTPATGSNSSSEPAQGGLGQVLSKMLSDPQTKDFLREQQRMMLDQMYGPLVKKMGLTPEEGKSFTDLMLDTAMKGTERASSLLGASSTNRTAALAQLAAENAAKETQIKELLGETRYAQYKDYQTTAGERIQLNQFRQQFGAGSLPLTEDQTEQLLGFMKEEKQTMASVGHPTVGSGQAGGEIEAILSEDRSESMLQSQEYVNERVYERAKTVLSEDQLSAFGKFQSNQLQMMRIGVGMARKFFAPEASQSATP